MTTEQISLATLFDKHRFELNQVRRWQIGPLTLLVQCRKSEWKIGFQRAPEWADFRDLTMETAPDQLPDDMEQVSRYVFKDTTRVLQMLPLLADRSVISRPETPTFVAAGAEVTLFVSTPLWLQLMVGSETPRPLLEIPVQRPSDTWFGSSTLEGRLCYATTTHCRLNLEELVFYKHRAITPIFIVNKAESMLTLERLNLPVTMLPVYLTDTQSLWTPRIVLRREQDGDMAELIVDKVPPREAEKSRLLTSPREQNAPGMLIRAFNAFFN